MFKSIPTTEDAMSPQNRAAVAVQFALLANKSGETTLWFVDRGMAAAAGRQAAIAARQAEISLLAIAELNN